MSITSSVRWPRTSASELSVETPYSMQRRDLPDDLQAALSALAERSIQRTLEPTTPEAARALAEIEAPAELKAWLADDVEALMARFQALDGPGPVRARLRVICTDACKKFHTDFVHLRLIVTYAGPGTQLLLDQAGARAAFQPNDDAPLEAFNHGLVVAAGGVRQALPGDVVLMLGAKHPNAGGLGALHRSPPLSSGGRRLVLQLDRVGAVGSTPRVRALPA